MYGQDYDYASTRIQGTVVRIEATGVPVYVHQVGRTGCLVTDIEDVGNNNVMSVKLDDLDMRPVRLGYVNKENGRRNAEYLVRIPKRRDWKQGLRDSNCSSDGQGFRHINMSDLRKTIMNEYPPLKGCIARSTKLGSITAWHRHWATDGKNVFYRAEDTVGEIIKGKVILKDDFAYLKEALEESLT